MRKTKPKKLPDLNLLREAFILKKDGTLIWKKRKNSSSQWNAKFAMKKAGTLSPIGYWRVQFLGKVRYCHRIVYALAYGIDPGKKQVDHIDGNRANNKPSNLRLATHMQNHRHLVQLSEKNTTGYRGVTWHKQKQKFVAHCRFRGKLKSLGLYKTAKEAGEVARKFREKHYKSFSGEKIQVKK